MQVLNNENKKFQLVYWLIAAALIVLFGFFVSWKFTWIVGVLAGVLSYPISQKVQQARYQSIVNKYYRK